MIESTKQKIKVILRTHEHTRASDNALIMQMLATCYGLHARGFERAYKLLPSVNTITRLRREIQSKHIDTRPPEPIYQKRMRAEIDWARRYSK